MKKLPILALSTLLFAGSATLGYAQEDPNGGHHSGKKIEELLHDHAERIKEGIRSGELTQQEVDTIRAKEDGVRVKMDEFKEKNHGFLTNNEEASLEATMAKLHEELHYDKHNDRVR